LYAFSWLGNYFRNEVGHYLYFVERYGDVFHRDITEYSTVGCFCLIGVCDLDYIKPRVDLFLGYMKQNPAEDSDGKLDVYLNGYSIVPTFVFE